MVLEEWIQHYISHGVDHLFLINNGSTDDFMCIIEKYKNKVTLFDFPEKHRQREHYNTAFQTFKHLTEWCIICDIDEYMFVKRPTRAIDNIASWISQSVSSDVIQISVQWKMFTSSGFDKQPSSIRKSFTKCSAGLHNDQKCIVRSSFVKELRIHTHVMTTHQLITKADDFMQLNHYAIMSKEYFEKVKMTRGDVDTQLSENARTWEYFNNYDKGEDEDCTLQQIVMSQENDEFSHL